jgi:hypothetical protein
METQRFDFRVYTECPKCASQVELMHDSGWRYWQCVGVSGCHIQILDRSSIKPDVPLSTGTKYAGEKKRQLFWGKQPIDPIVAARRKQDGMKIANEARRQKRRYKDLSIETGIPPSTISMAASGRCGDDKREILAKALGIEL